MVNTLLTSNAYELGFEFLIAGEFNLTPGVVLFEIPGDLDFDNDVDSADFLAWQRGHGPAYDAAVLLTTGTLVIFYRGRKPESQAFGSIVKSFTKFPISTGAFDYLVLLLNHWQHV